MRRLLLLVLALVLALWARSILLSPDLPEAVTWRDGGLLLVFAALIFAWNAPPPLIRLGLHLETPIPQPSRAIGWAGLLGLILAALAGGRLYLALADPQVEAPTWAGLLLVLAALLAVWDALAPSRSAADAFQDDGTWSPAKARLLLHRVLDVRLAQGVDPFPLSPRARMGWLLFILALAGLIRLVGSPGLGGDCLPEECQALTRALTWWQTPDLETLLRDPAPLFTAVHAALLGPVADAGGPYLALFRALGLLAGLAGVALAFVAGLSLHGGGMAVAGGLLMALLPWHVALSRSPRPGLWLALGLLAVAALLIQARAHDDRRRYAAAGLAAGLTAWTAPTPWGLALLAWLLVAPAPGRRLAAARPLVILALPRLLLALDADLWRTGLDRLGPTLQDLAAAWLADPGQTLAWAGVLAWLGLAYTLRHLAWPGGRVLLLGWSLALAALLWSPADATVMDQAGFWALTTLLAALAVDALLRQAALTWRPLVAPGTWLRLAGTVLVLAFLVGKAQTWMGEASLTAAPSPTSPPGGAETGSGADRAENFVVQEGEAPVPPLPELPIQQIWTVGSCGPGQDQFQGPRGLAIDPGSGQVYVADPGNRRVVVRDLADGGLVRLVEDENFQEPFDLDVDMTGQIYLLDSVVQQIFRLDPVSGDRFLVPAETAFYRPRGLGVDIFGMLVIADTGGARVVHMQPDGRVLAQYGGPDTALGRGQPVDAMGSPLGILWAVTAEDGRLWRLDSGEGRVVVTRSNTFEGPHLAGTGSGAFFLSDPEGRRILFLDEIGTPLAQFGGEGSFVKPVGLDVAEVGSRLLLAVSDPPTCQVSLWQVGE